MFLALINIVFATNSEIVGVWVDSYNNYDEYKADGTYVGFNIDNNKKYIGVTGKYKIESDKIIITFTTSESCKVNVGDIESIRYTIKDNQLIYIDNKGKVINKLKRVK